MALIQCKECGKSISEDAGASPQCGKPIERSARPEPQSAPKKRSILPVVIVLIIAAAAGFFIYRKVVSSSIDLTGIKENIEEKIKGKQKKEQVTLCDDILTIKTREYDFRKIELEAPSTVTIECTVLSGPMIDIVTVHERDFELWEQKKRTDIIPVTKLSAPGQEENVLDGDLPAGIFYVIIDHTDYGATSPPRSLMRETTEITLKITCIEND